MRLTLLHFNDLHGRLAQLPRLFTLTRRERERAQAAGRTVLLLDGGDSSDRHEWASVVTQGRANFSLLEAMGVQASVVGNGEAFNWGKPGLARLIATVGFPVLAANLMDAADPTQLAVPGLKGSVLLDLDGFALGLVGLTQTFVTSFARDGYALVDPTLSLRRELDRLRGQGARLIVLLSHLGFTTSEAQVRASGKDAWHDDTLAAAFPEIGVIVGGHTHTALPTPVQVGHTLIVQAGKQGHYLGRLDVDVDDATGAVTAYEGRLIICDPSVPLDPTIQGTLELVEEEAQRLRQRPAAG